MHISLFNSHTKLLNVLLFNSYQNILGKHELLISINLWTRDKEPFERWTFSYLCISHTWTRYIWKQCAIPKTASPISARELPFSHQLFALVCGSLLLDFTLRAWRRQWRKMHMETKRSDRSRGRWKHRVRGKREREKKSPYNKTGDINLRG